MSIPDREIPDAEQDQVRDQLRGTAFRRLAREVRDRVVRAIWANGATIRTVLVYRRLFEDAFRLPDLRPEEQARCVDVLQRRSFDVGTADAVGRASAAIAGSSLSGAARGAAIDVLAAPLVVSASEATVDRDRCEAYFWDGYEHRQRVLAALLRHPRLPSSGDDRSALLRVLARMHADGAAALLDALEPGYGRYAPGVATTDTPLLLSPDSAGVSLLASFARLADGAIPSRVGVGWCHFEWPAPRPPRARGRGRRPEPTPPPRMGDYHPRDDGDVPPTVRRARVLAELVCEATHPDEFLNQDNRGTCVATSILHRLASQQPAEFARLAVDLVLDGSTTLRSGAGASVPDDAFAFDRSTRSPTERLTQAAFMAYARSNQRRRGAALRYYNVRPRGLGRGNDADAFSDGLSGLDAGETKRLADATLLGAPFTIVTHQPAQALLAHFSSSSVPVIAALPGHEVEIVRVRGPQSHAWSIRPPPDSRVLEPGAYYWNPWGAALVMQVNGSLTRVHEGTVEPPSAAAMRSGQRWRHRTVDDTRGLQFIPWSDLRHLLRRFLRPTP